MNTPLQSGGADARENSFDHHSSIVFGKGAVTRKQTKNHRTINEIENDLRIELFGNIATQHATLPHDTRGITSRVKELISKECEKAGIALPFRDELTKQFP